MVDNRRFVTCLASKHITRHDNASPATLCTVSREKTFQDAVVTGSVFGKPMVSTFVVELPHTRHRRPASEPGRRRSVDGATIESFSSRTRPLRSTCRPFSPPDVAASSSKSTPAALPHRRTTLLVARALPLRAAVVESRTNCIQQLRAMFN